MEGWQLLGNEDSLHLRNSPIIIVLMILVALVQGLCGVVALCYQHQVVVGGADNKVPQLHATQSESLDYGCMYLSGYLAIVETVAR